MLCPGGAKRSIWLEKSDTHRGFAFFLFKLTKLHFYFTHQIGEISYWVYIISKTTAEPCQSKYSNESDVFWDLTKHSGYRILWYDHFFVLLIHDLDQIIRQEQQLLPLRISWHAAILASKYPIALCNKPSTFSHFQSRISQTKKQRRLWRRHERRIGGVEIRTLLPSPLPPL